ncbi:hypothetical protein C3L33_02793, partial [Rhododendron williamsianum]
MTGTVVSLSLSTTLKSQPSSEPSDGEISTLETVVKGIACLLPGVKVCLQIWEVLRSRFLMLLVSLCGNRDDGVVAS